MREAASRQTRKATNNQEEGWASRLCWYFAIKNASICCARTVGERQLCISLSSSSRSLALRPPALALPPGHSSRGHVELDVDVALHGVGIGTDGVRGLNDLLGLCLIEAGDRDVERHRKHEATLAVG